MKKISICLIIFLLTGVLILNVSAQSLSGTDWLGNPVRVPGEDGGVLRIPPSPSASQGPILFDEPEFIASADVNGYSTSTLNGAPLPGTLSFTTSIPNDARFSSGPPMQDYLDGYGIEGSDQQLLTINFGVDVSFVQFSFALCENVLTTVPNGVTVQAYDQSGTSVGTTSADAFRDADDFFPEAIVAWNLPSDARYVELTFATVSCGRFLVDELSYYDVGAPSCSFTVDTVSSLSTGTDINFGTGTEAVALNFNNLGSPPVSAVTVTCYPENHPNATTPLETGYWWDITYLPNNAGTVSPFSVNLSLPGVNITPDAGDKVCRYTGSGWDCAYSSHTSSVITRNNVSQFSNWTVGDDSGPTSVQLQSFSSAANNGRVNIAIIGGLLAVCLLLVSINRRWLEKGG